MVNEKKFLKEFKEIDKGNKEYVDWKKDAILEIDKLDLKSLENMKKRYKIKLGCIKDWKSGNIKMVTAIVPLLVSVLTIVIPLSMSVITSLVSTLNSFSSEVKDIDTYFSRISEILYEIFGQEMVLLLIGFCLGALYVCAASLLDNFLEKNNAYKIMYYEEIISIIEDKISGRKFVE